MTMEIIKMKKLLCNIEKNAEKLMSMSEFNNSLNDEEKIIFKRNLHRMNIGDKKIYNMDFLHSSLRGIFMSNSYVENCNFYKCSFITSILDDSIFRNCNFISCVFIGMSAYNTLFEMCDIYDSFYHVNDIKHAKFSSTNFYSNNLLY